MVEHSSLLPPLELTMSRARFEPYREESFDGIDREAP